MKKSKKIAYYVVTGLFSAMMAMGAGMYFFNHEVAVEMWTALGFPLYLIYPLGVAKILGLVAIWSNLSKQLKEFAYAGYFFTFLLAISAHINLSDGQAGGAIFALVLAAVSYFLGQQMDKEKTA